MKMIKDIKYDKRFKLNCYQISSECFYDKCYAFLNIEQALMFESDCYKIVLKNYPSSFYSYFILHLIGL